MTVLLDLLASLVRAIKGAEEISGQLWTLAKIFAVQHPAAATGIFVGVGFSYALCRLVQAETRRKSINAGR
ncbi:MAG: hypothetical protein WCF77_03915 [Minisyncoccia bacterium]